VNNSPQALGSCLELAVSENGGDPSVSIGFKPNPEEMVDAVETREILSDYVTENQRQVLDKHWSETQVAERIQAQNPIKH
jgi:hypothetical protein